jgi:molybdopterin-guanine dinucleotide biosynthesis protein A
MDAHVTGVILAGGPAVRYGGRPKGLERIGGIRIIDRVAVALRPAVDALLLIANDPAADRWLPGIPVAADIEPGLGSLGGIRSAVARAAGPALVVAWDMPFVPSALLVEIARLATEGMADVVVPESRSHRGVEPVCAWYGPACLPAIEQALAADDRRVIGFYDRVRITRIPLAVVERYGDPARIFLNVNTADDLATAERAAEHTSEVA